MATVLAWAVGSIRDYYVDPNLTEEDRALMMGGWMSRFGIPIHDS